MYCLLCLCIIREIHPLDPQSNRYCMLASTASAPRVTRCSLGLYWSSDLCSKHALAGWGMLSYLGQIVRGSEIWWFMTSTHSLSTPLRYYSGKNKCINQCVADPVRKCSSHNFTKMLILSPQYWLKGTFTRITWMLRLSQKKNWRKFVAYVAINLSPSNIFYWRSLQQISSWNIFQKMLSLANILKMVRFFSRLPRRRPMSWPRLTLIWPWMTLNDLDLPWAAWPGLPGSAPGIPVWTWRNPPHSLLPAWSTRRTPPISSYCPYSPGWDSKGMPRRKIKAG